MQGRGVVRPMNTGRFSAWDAIKRLVCRPDGEEGERHISLVQQFADWM